MYEIIPALPSHITDIRRIAEITWPVAYGHILSAEQLQYMLGLFYSDQALNRQMTEQEHRFILLVENTRNVGFASYSLMTGNDPGRYRLHKLYVLPETQGKGYGKILIEHILQDIHSKHGNVLELNVNRFNNARLFYEKLGFHITREEDINIGNGYWMNDYVMERKVY